MTRTKRREIIFRIIFRMEFNTKAEMEEQLELALQEYAEEPEEDLAYMREKVKDITAHADEIDILISEASEGWSLRRIGKAELAILRLGVYEEKYEADIDDSLAINEAVQLAKRYGDSGAPAFINGILARIAG